MARWPVGVYDCSIKETVMQKAFLLLAATTMIAAAPAADLDQNGEVSRAEFMAASDARFATADINFDGQLTLDELKSIGEARRVERAKKRFAKTDANGDGSVSEAEMLAAREAMLSRHSNKKSDRRDKLKARIDTNADGEISDAERAAARDMAKAKRAERPTDRKSRRADRPRFDANRDGFVSKTEYDAMADALFIRMDANGDGVLTQGEGRGRKGGRR
jgi:Ca2+-binding EF-hand superfamily protein